MGRRKRAYVVVRPPRSSQSTSRMIVPLPPNDPEWSGGVEKPFRPLPVLKQASKDWNVHTAMTPLTSPRLGKWRDKARFTTLRRRLRYFSGANAVLTWVATTIAYYDIRDNQAPVESKDELREVLWGVSLFQIVLLVAYTGTVVAYSECIRSAYNINSEPLVPLLRSPKLLLFCVFQAGFHLLLLPPRVSLQTDFHQMRTSSLLGLNDLFFVFILLRNYHSVQFLYWCSRFSQPRNYAFLSFAKNVSNTSFTLKAYLATYTLRFVLLLYGAFVIVSGLLLYTVEKGTSDPQFGYSQNSLWAVSVLQTTVGYGDIVPTTYLGQLSIAVNCFLGSSLVALITSSTSSRLTLSRTECELYSELAYTRYKRRHMKQAIVMIQRWWKLMTMRQKRELNGRIIVNFYFQLRTHRRVLAAAQGQKDRSFDLQLHAFEKSTSKSIRSLKEYLQPTHTALSLVQDIIRLEYNLYLQSRNLKHTLKRIRRNSHQFGRFTIYCETQKMTLDVPRRKSMRLSSIPGSPVELAVVKLKVFQKVRTRLISEDTPAMSRSTSPVPPTLM